MMGSGTALAIARAEGHRAIGVDIDTLSVLIAKVWTSSIDPQEVREKAIEVLSRARAIFRTLRVGDAYPKGADAETRQFIRYWFDGYSRRQLCALATVIGRSEEHTSELQSHLNLVCRLLLEKKKKETT